MRFVSLSLLGDDFVNNHLTSSIKKQQEESHPRTSNSSKMILRRHCFFNDFSHLSVLSLVFTLLVFSLFSFSHVSAGPAPASLSLSQHLNQQLKSLTGKIFFLTPPASPVGSAASSLQLSASRPVASIVSPLIAHAVPSSQPHLVAAIPVPGMTGNNVRGSRALASAAASVAATASKSSKIRKTRVLSLLALPKGIRAALPLLGFKKPSASSSPLTSSASVLRPVFAASTSLLAHRLPLVSGVHAAQQFKQQPTPTSNQQVVSFPAASSLSLQPAPQATPLDSAASSSVNPSFGFPNFASLPPFLGDVSLVSSAASGVSSGNTGNIGEATLTQEELAQYASGQSFTRQPTQQQQQQQQQQPQLQQQIQFIPLSHGLRSLQQQQASPFNFNSPLLLPQMHFPQPQEQGQYHHLYHQGMEAAGNAGQSHQQQDLQNQQGYHFQGQPQEQQDPSSGQPEDPEKVMYIYVDEDGKTVASKVADSNQGPEVALPEGYIVRQVGGEAPPSSSQDATENNNSDQSNPQVNAPSETQPQEDGNSNSSGQDQNSPSQPQSQQEMSYAHAQSYGENNNGNNENANHNHQPAPSNDQTPPASVSYANEEGQDNRPGSHLSQLEDARQVIVSYPGHHGQFLVRLKKKPTEIQEEFPTTPSGQVTPVVTSADAIETTLSPPDSSQDMVFMLGDYNNFIKGNAHQGNPVDAVQNDAAPEAGNSNPLDFLTSLAAGHPIGDDYLNNLRPPSVHIHSSPPVTSRGVVRERTTRGGWIPIPRTQPLPPTTGTYHRDPAAPSTSEGSSPSSSSSNDPKYHQGSLSPPASSSSSQNRVLFPEGSTRTTSHTTSYTSQDENNSKNQVRSEASRETATSASVSKSDENDNKQDASVINQRQPKVHFDDVIDGSEDNDSARSPSSENSGVGSNTRVAYSVSSSISSVSNKINNNNYGLREAKDSTPAASEIGMIRDEEVMKTSTTTTPRTPVFVQKRSKYNVAAVFDHEFKPILTPSKNLEDLKDHEIISAPKGSFGLRLAPGQTRTTRSLETGGESEEGEGGRKSTAVPSYASFTQRSGQLMSSSSNIEETLKKPTGQFLVPIPGQDGNIKAYVVLSA